MKLGLTKRVLAIGICATMLLGDMAYTAASGSVSGGDAVSLMQPQSENVSISGNDVVNDVVIEASDNTVADTITVVEPPATVTETVDTVTTVESVTVSGNDMKETVSGNDAVAEDIVLVTETSGVTITLTAPAGSLPENAELWAKEIDQSAQLAIIDEALETEAEKEEIEVQQYKAFDIKILVDGVEVQPAEGVTVSFAGDILLPQKEEESVTVYHVTEDAVANDMEATVTEANEVEMETTHFSIYVIVVKDVTDTRTVTFNHFLGTPGNGTQIYAPSTLTVDKEHQITSQELPIQGGGNYQLDTVVVKSTGKEDVTYTNDLSDNQVVIELTDIENTIEMYYSEVTQVKNIQTTFFDYYVDDTKEETQIVYEAAGIYQSATLSFELDGVYYENYTFVDAGSGKFAKWVDGYNVYDHQGNWIRWENGYYTNEMYIHKNAVLTNVTSGELRFDEVIFKDAVLVTAKEMSVTATKDAGINGVNYVAGEPFLSMGISNNSIKSSIGGPADVASYADYGLINNSGMKVNINTNNTRETGDKRGEYAIVNGLIQRLSGENYENLEMGYAYPIKGYVRDVDGVEIFVVDEIDTTEAHQIREPGYFTKDASDNKVVLENYELYFNTVGNSFSLDYALNTENNHKTYSWKEGTPWGRDGVVNNMYFPLNDAKIVGGRTEYQPYNNVSWFDNSNNYYFGMRYDFNFSLGSYIGPMNYEFYGDDDLWVFVDGELVLDLGGMHSAYPGKYEETPDANKVDLWSEVFGIDTTQENWWEGEAYKNLDKNEEHQVTILFMERGAFESSCAMRFVIPNVAAKDPVISNVPKASLELIKKDSDTQAVISGVGFTLYADAACTQMLGREKFTGDDGKVSFTDLKAGSYYLKETTWNGNEYVVDDTKVYIVKVSADDTKATAVIDGLSKDGSAYVVYNTPIKTTTLEFYKVDRYTHEPLANVKFYLRKDNAQGEIVGTVVTAENGYFKFERIETGIYYLEEDLSTVPEGYKAPDRGWTFEVKEVNGVLTYDAISTPNGLWWKNAPDYCGNLVKNEPYVSFMFTKIDSETEEVMSGVEFKLYEGINNNRSNLVATVLSDADGNVKFNNLVVGQTYLLVETTPEGYVAVETPWVIKIDYENGEYIQKIYIPTFHEASNEWRYDNNSLAESNNIIENTPAVGALTITKTVDEINMAYGAPTFTFKIVGPEGVLYRTICFDDANVTTKSITVEEILVGEYTVTELDTLRYTLNEEKSGYSPAVVTDTITPEFSFYNELTNDDDYSHSDVVVNSFRRNTKGGIEISKNLQVIE